MNYPDVIDTLCNLIRINSVNPAYANGRNEHEIQQYIAGFFTRAGIPVEWQEISPGRANVVAKLSGRNPQRRLILEAHVDTAGIENMTVPPFEPELRDGRVSGRGACDTKGGLAAMMHAMLAVHKSATPPPGDVWLAAAADEEHSYRGVLRLCEGLSATGAIVAEPTDMRAVVASKGCLRWRVTVSGRAAHSSKPHLGINAITRMARFVVALEEEQKQLNSMWHPLVGSPTINIGIIHGGSQVNIVPDECYIEIDRRLIPGESLAEVQHRYDILPEALRKEIPDFHVSQSPLLSDWPMETATDAEIVKVASAVLKEAQLDPAPVGVPFGSDASKLVRSGIPTIVLGPGSIDQAHTADESVPIDEVVKVASVYEQIILRF
jgi:acetylornithine deacetylase/succinyl-diaminopimelate desuccinylase family protein